MKRLLILILCTSLNILIQGSSASTKEKIRVNHAAAQIEEWQALQEASLDSKKCIEYCNRWPSGDYPYDVDQELDPHLVLSKATWWTGCIVPLFESNFLAEVPATLLLIDLGAMRAQQKEGRERAMKLARLVQEKRTDKNATLKILFKVLCHQPNCAELAELFEDYFEAWLREYPTDPNAIILWEGMTMAEMINRMIRDKQYRSQALLAAYALQPYRRDFPSVLKSLFKAFEDDQTDENILFDLKKWVCVTGSNIPMDYLLYDENQTFGAKIDSLGNEKLIAFFHRDGWNQKVNRWWCAILRMVRWA